MAKKFQKVLALLLTLLLCAGQLTIPVSAKGRSRSAGDTKREHRIVTASAAKREPRAVVASDINAESQPVAATDINAASQTAATNIDGESQTVTTSDIDGGTRTVTVTTESDGTQTTTIHENTETPETGTTHQSTTTEKITSSADGSQTNVDTTWNSTTTQTGSDTENGNPTVTTDINITTTVTGSENTTESSTASGRTQTVEGSTKGSEETNITGTTVTTTTNTDVLFHEEDSSKTENIPMADPHSVSTSTGWVEGEVSEGQWQEGAVQTGEALTTADESSNKTQIEATNPGEATLLMKPDGTAVEVAVDVTIDQVLAGVTIPEGAEEVRKDGKVIGYTFKTVTETSTPDSDPTVGETKEIPSAPIQTPVAPTGYTEGTVLEGNVTTHTEAIRDDAGNIIGYRITKTTVTEDTDVTTTESTQDTTTQISTGETVHSLPVRPEESESTDQFGYVTKTVVEDIVENGNVVGYKSTTTYYDPAGEMVSTESSSIYGTTSSSNTQVQKDPETEVETVKTTITKTEVNEIFSTVSTKDTTLVTERTNNITTTILTEEDTYQLMETEDGLYFLYKGTMQPVVALTGHGDVDLTGLTPTVTPSNANDLASNTSISNPPSIVNPGDPGSDQFKYVDYGLISKFKVTKADGNNTSEVHLYKLVDKEGNAYYAYCADLDTTAYRNTIYDISNANDVNYYQNNQDQDAYAHLLTIAINGYWGTSSSTGSMAAIKQLLIDNGRSDIAATITDGEAMTATQAAIWTFGNKSSSNLVNSSNPAANVGDKTSRANIKALYDILISDGLKNATPNKETDIITEKDITGATLDLKGRVTDNNGTVVKDSSGNEKYNADLTFTLDVEESALTGNLKVIVRDSNNNTLREEQLLTDNSNLFGKLLADNGDTEGYYYTIENLEIAEGVTINLNLEGYQNLKKGVYIYTAATGSHESSQTFIGIAEGTRDVNLQTQLTFTVEDPQLEHVEKSTTQTRNDIRIDRKEDHRTDTKTDTQETSKITVTVATDTNKKIYGTETLTETKQDITRESRSWESRWNYSLETTSDEQEIPDKPDSPDEPDTPHKPDSPDEPDSPDDQHVPDKPDVPSHEPSTQIPEKKVPLANAPKTGDLSGVWAMISGLSLGGIAMLNRKRKEEA